MTPHPPRLLFAIASRLLPAPGVGRRCAPGQTLWIVSLTLLIAPAMLGEGIQRLGAQPPVPPTLEALPPDHPTEEAEPLAWIDEPLSFEESWRGEVPAAMRAPNHRAAPWRAQNDAPVIPEPLVFDLVRPLGAKQGELEFNTLMLVPLSSSRGGAGGLPDPGGLVPRSPDLEGIEWAPEVEYAIVDGFAVEFELPFERDVLEAYKFAAQWTFGTAFDNQYIHGTQSIVQYNIDPGTVDLTVLYLAGARFDEIWSTLMMAGFRSELGGDSRGERTQQLFNFNIFADLTDNLVGGFETNLATSLNGRSTMLVMPQLHWELDQRWMIQSGAGVLMATDFTLPLAGFRFIRTF